MIALIWILAAGAARAEDATITTSADRDDRVDWRLWSWSRAEALPDHHGDGLTRASQTLRLDLRVDGGWRFDALGGVRDPAMDGEPVEPDLYRLSLRHRSAWYSLAAGRVTRLDSRGAMRLDGVSLDLGSDRRLHGGLWGGVLWHPETWEVGSTAVFGGELRGQPLPSGALDLGLGYEARWAEQEGQAELAHRVFGSGAVRAVNGARLALLAEVDAASAGGDDGDGGLPDARATARLGSPLGRHADVSATARWEGLPASYVPVALTDPTEWLAGEGYGAVEAEGRLHLGAVTLLASGGPTWLPEAADPGTGGRARLGAQAHLLDHLELGAAAIHAAVDSSWIRGGVLEAGVHAGHLRVGADAGWFRFQPLAGPLAGVWEGRLTAQGALPIAARGLQEISLQGWTATGSDRVLEPWVRGGLSLVGRLGTMPEDTP